MALPTEHVGEEPVEIVADRTLDEIEASLTAIERSIDGFDDGTYGKCEICGQSIESDRLMARVSDRRCATHATA